MLQLDSTDEEEEGGLYLRSNASEDELAEKDRSETEENDIESNSNKLMWREEETTPAMKMPESRVSHGFSRKLTALEIPCKDSFLEKLMSENQIAESSINSFPPGSPMDVYETAEESFMKNSMSLEDDETKEEAIPEESIFQRINSHKEMKSFQLGKQLSCKWSTGSGPRIGCLREYPSRLQCHALEQANLSPRRKHRLKLDFPSRASTPTGGNLSRRSSRQCAMQLSPVKGLTGSSFYLTG